MTLQVVAPKVENAATTGPGMPSASKPMPYVGMRVIYYQPERETPYNGHYGHPAVVTSVHGPSCVNLKVFFDCGPVEDRTSQRFNADGTTGDPHYAK